jgi:cell wall-associated NlpC family hydrolase
MADRQGTIRHRSHVLVTLAAGAATLAAVLALVPSAGARARPAAAGAAPEVGYVDVSVATVWTDPSKPRPVDAPALTNPTRIGHWLKAMSVKQYLGLTEGNRTQTQALYGAPLDILGYQDGWYEVAVPGQPTPKNALGYPGWVPAAQVSFDARYGQLQSSRPFAEVDKAAAATLYRDAAMTQRFMRASYDTRLPVIGQSGQVVQVAVPSGGSAYVSAGDVSVYSSVSAIPYPTGQQLVAAAKLFLGRPYLWGGTSGFAFDCSGLTHTVYDAHGITIGRDADAQADFTGHGTRVPRSDLQPGDILFYASDLSDPSTIYHDAMYAGHGKMIEAYGAGVPIRITRVRFNKDYWGAERYLTH